MSLRARLGIALAVTAALPVIAVGLISYVTTSHALHRQLDATLSSYASRLADPDGRAVAALCSPRPVSEGENGDPGETLAGLPGAGVECISASGTITRWIPPAGEKAPPVPASLRGTRRPGLGSPETVEVSGERFRFVTYTAADGTSVRVGRSLAETDRSLSSIRGWSLAAGAAVIAAAALAGVLLARRITEPVEALTATAEEIARTGRTDREVPVERRDEIGRLGQAFRTMLAALERSRAQQQQLVQDAGHELRTPLTSVRANVGTLRRHPDLGGVPRDELLDAVDAELTELSTLVDELVDLAVDEPDREEPDDVRLDEVARQVAARAERRSGRPVRCDAAPVVVRARPRLLATAVGNLVDNALKFSPDTSPVEVTVLADPREVVVRDHGPGIAARDLPHVFDRFYRAVEARSMPGSGLGLSIVKRAAEDSGGQVGAANHPDGGAVITMTWPGEADDHL